MNWYLASCPVCRGDLHDDLDELGSVACFACGRSFAASDLGLHVSLPVSTSTSERRRKVQAFTPGPKTEPEHPDAVKERDAA